MNNERFVRFSTEKSILSRFGVIREGALSVLNFAPWEGGSETGERLNVQEIRLLAPVTPSKIVCVGLNYHAHVSASFSADKPPDTPLIFLKPPSSVIGPKESIVHPEQSERVDYEAELGIVIGKLARFVSEETALDHIFGFTCVNDVTARDLQKKDGQWGRAKGFDTFCPVGPWIIPRDDIDFANAQVEGILNDNVMQSGNTSQMIFSIPTIICYISSVMTLEPGDLIATGTPSGIAPMKPGDTIVVRIAGIGELSNTMVAQSH
ncbi:MAG: fumarylacetoacetate hydrolase family protein [candidate division Zixibacteria bacterium]|nr:fumarylacetoacetate hydrolase family protein [candidate division Zixibacteria bacterium]